jgi:3-oxoacyl-[acyl-carrier protein] reductase
MNSFANQNKAGAGASLGAFEDHKPDGGGRLGAFEDHNVVVTGGTRGIGRAIVLDFLAQGARVWALGRGNQAAEQALAEAAGSARERLCVERCDVSSDGDVAAFWERFEAVPGGLQVLVCNAGIRRDRVLAMMSSEEWSSVLETNLGGTFRMCKQGVQRMLRERYGRIVIVTSPAGQHGFEGQANYSASKAGQIGLLRSLAREVASRGITVNGVSPGFVETELLGDLDEATRKAHLARVPLKRFGRPEEIAWAVRMLAAREGLVDLSGVDAEPLHASAELADLSG